MSRSRDRAARSVPGLHTVRRPGAGDEPDLDLAYIRDHPGNGPVVLVVPGGPGLAVALPYREFREQAARAGLDLIMVEHRGVGLSRTGTDGNDLPPAALTVPHVVADLEAVLDAEEIDRAIVTGTSYGSYVAAAFAVTHPDRLHGLILDSATMSAHEADTTRAFIHALLWDGDSAQTSGTARRVRSLVRDHGLEPVALGRVVATLYEFGGTELADTYLAQLAQDRARTTTAMVRALQDREVGEPIRHVMEFDLVQHIYYAELDRGEAPDGRIFHPNALFHDPAAPAFRGEHYELTTQLRAVTAPALVLSGDRDLRTVRTVAEDIARVLPEGVLVPLPGHGHSALDTRPSVMIDAILAVADGVHRAFPARAAASLERAPLAGAARHLPTAVRAALAVDRMRAPLRRGAGDRARLRFPRRSRRSAPAPATSVG